MSDPIARLNQALEGRYKINRELGEGGMATVYLAEDLKHERKVAVNEPGHRDACLAWECARKSFADPSASGGTQLISSILPPGGMISQVPPSRGLLSGSKG